MGWTQFLAVCVQTRSRDPPQGPFPERGGTGDVVTACSQWDATGHVLQPLACPGPAIGPFEITVCTENRYAQAGAQTAEAVFNLNG